MRRRPSAIIVGGSVSGLAAGHTLARAGWRVTVLERSSGELAERGAGLGLDIGPLEAVLGGRGHLPARLMIRGREVAFAQHGRVYLQREHAYGTHVAWQGLYRSLMDGFPGDLRSGARVTSVATDPGAHVILEDGSVLEADLIIGADGYRSIVRSTVSGGASEPSYAGYVLWRGLMEPEDITPEIRQRFLDGRVHLFSGAGRHLVLYEIPGAGDETEPASRRLNWGWYDPVPPERIRPLLGQAGQDDPRNVPIGAMPASTLSWLARRADATWPDPWRNVILITIEKRRLFAAVIHQYMPNRLVRATVVLVGDAAHVASPITGAGARTALREALALHAALSDEVNGHSTGMEPALAAFESEQLPRARALVAQGRRWGRDFLADGAGRAGAGCRHESPH